MSKTWFTAVVLGLACTVAVAKDKDKNNAPKSGRGAQAAPRPAERSQPQRPAPSQAPKPATPAPAQKSVAPTPKPAPAPVQRSVPAPSQNLAPRPADTPRKTADAPKPFETRPSNERSRPSFNPETPKAAPNQGAIPAGKTGTALGPRPAPNTPNAGPSLRPAPEKSAEHKHTTNKPLPTAPKFETNKKIPPFGSQFSGQAKTDHKHGDSKPDAGHQHLGITSKPANRPNISHDHDRRDHDDHRHNHGSSRRSNWSLIILGGAAPLGGGWYGPGYGRTYGGWNNNAYYVPAQSYVPAPNVAVPVTVNSNALPQPARTANEDFSILPIARQRELLLQALNALEDDFARSPNGDEWSRQLQLATTAKLIGEGDDPMEPVTRARLRSVVELFDEVAANPDYRPVSELLSFRSLQAGLREFASEPIGQARGRLSRTADLLTQQLKTWPTGERWKDYLQVAWLVGTEEEERIDMPERLVRFEKLLAKFDRVKSDEQFQVVSQEPTFGTTHAALQVFVRELRLVVEAHVAEPSLPELKLPEPKLIEQP
ncbi:MAG: hypothetical protein IAG10_26780 [Planctomycetaceae bacterium]|nr:hypothetical protein [Planctomycetaceae bacterium]